MRNKRGMYFNYSKSYNGKNKRRKHGYRRNNRNTGLYVIAVFIIAIILGFGVFYFTKQRLKDPDETLHAQEKLRNQTDESDQPGKAETDESDQPGKSETVDSDQPGKVETVDSDQITDKATESDELDKIEKIDITDGIIGRNTPKGPDIPKGQNTPKGEDLSEVNTEELTEEVFMPGFVDTRTPVKVKGIYVTGPRAGSEREMLDLIDLVDTTELNAMVIDIKNDSGEITYKMDLAAVQKMDADVNYISNMEQLIKDLKAKDIYLIARIVAFKDPILANKRPELSLKNKDGTIFKDKDGLSWVNPYKTEVWDYLLSVAKEAVNLGFDEIQFDYIRFSTDSAMKHVNFGKESKDKTKTEVITEFTKYASESLKPLGVFVSADVYGTVIDSKIDSEIVGQSYVEMSKYLDSICPMIYPSHYANGAYGIEYPDTEPYNLILKVLNKSKFVLKDIKENKEKVVIRSWLQDFTAVWLTNHISYGPEEIRAQIKAIYDAGYEEWILWNGSNNYTKDGLLID